MNLYSFLTPSEGHEAWDILLFSEKVRIERIISHAASSPPGFWYEQDEDEWVLVLQGHALLTLPDGLHRLAAGDNLFIPARTRHRVEDTSGSPPCLWLCVFIKNEKIAIQQAEE